MKEKRKSKPVTKAAEVAVCRGLGIIQDGEDVTEAAMAEFARCFDGEVSGRAMGALRALFKVATPEDDAIEEALLSHGGAAGLDLQDLDGDDATINA